MTIRPEDIDGGLLADSLPGWRVIADFDGAFSRRDGALGAGDLYRPYWLLLDSTWRVADCFELGQGEAAVAALGHLATASGTSDGAPVLVVPRVLEDAFCRQLVVAHSAQALTPSGVARDVGGRTRSVLDPTVKVRRDLRVPPGPLADQLLARLKRRLLPMLKRCFQFETTYVERLLVGCYDAAEGGHFKAHRDDRTQATAHRRFAVTINLNEDYEGGELRFPEFGERTYRPALGTALVFSCSLLHEVSPVRRGRRYTMVPFLLDRAGAEQRDRNRAATAVMAD